MNSRTKGKVGEREWRDVLRSEGFLNSRRGQQFSGGSDSPDVICDDLPWSHWEIKRVQKLNIINALNQAIKDAGSRKIPLVAHRPNHAEWMITMRATDFFKILRQDLPW